MTQDGDMITWNGSGVGKFKEKGALSYRGILYYRTTSQKLARLNSAAGVSNTKLTQKGKRKPKFGNGSKTSHQQHSIPRSSPKAEPDGLR